MNAITRAASIRGAKNYLTLSPVRFSLMHLLMSFLIICVLFSAFGVVYFKDLNRRMFIVDQNLQQIRQQYEIDWGKLLLEESAWSTQSRIQQIAQNQLGMEIPQQSDIVLSETTSQK